MKSKEFGRWIDHIYNTNGKAFDCQQTQTILPKYVDSIVDNKPLETTIEQQILYHLHHCKDCQEIYDGLKYVVMEDIVLEDTVPV